MSCAILGCPLPAEGSEYCTRHATNLTGMRKVQAVGKDGKPNFEQGIALSAGVALLREYDKAKAELVALRKVKEAARACTPRGDWTDKEHALVRACDEADALAGRIPR
jgi:hypothetical protein